MKRHTSVTEQKRAAPIGPGILDIEGVKQRIVTAIAAGEPLAVILKREGVSEGWFRRQRQEPAFFYAVDQALGGYGDWEVRPTPTKAAFPKLLELLPHYPSLGAACEKVKITPSRLRSMLLRSPARREAFDRALAAAPQRIGEVGRGKRPPRHGFNGPAFEALVSLMEQGIHLAAACRLTGISDSIIEKRRRRDREFDRRIRQSKGYIQKRAKLARRDVQLAVLEKIRDGVPTYALIKFGLPSQSSLYAYLRSDERFSAEMGEAVRAGEKARFDVADRYEHVLGAIRAGVKVKRLPSLGLPGLPLICEYRKRHPEFDERYRAAMKVRRGDTLEVVALAPAELVALVEKKLPLGMSSWERQECRNQAWLDALEGRLTTSTMSAAIRRYIAAARPLALRGSYVDQNGDLAHGDRAEFRR